MMQPPPGSTLFPYTTLFQSVELRVLGPVDVGHPAAADAAQDAIQVSGRAPQRGDLGGDRKSTRLNSSHANISYAVFCLKKKKKPDQLYLPPNRLPDMFYYFS